MAGILLTLYSILCHTVRDFIPNLRWGGIRLVLATHNSQQLWRTSDRDPQRQVQRVAL